MKRLITPHLVLPGLLPASLVLAVLASTCLLTGCGQHTTQSTGESQPPVQLSKGQQLFLSNCVGCHQGAGNPPGPNAVVLDSTTLNSEDSFRALLRHPKSAMMRTFSADDLSDADVHEIYGYLMGLRTPQAGSQS